MSTSLLDTWVVLRRRPKSCQVYSPYALYPGLTLIAASITPGFITAYWFSWQRRYMPSSRRSLKKDWLHRYAITSTSAQGSLFEIAGHDCRRSGSQHHAARLHCWAVSLYSRHGTAAFDWSISYVLEGRPHCRRILPILFQRLPAMLRCRCGALSQDPTGKVEEHRCCRAAGRSSSFLHPTIHSSMRVHAGAHGILSTSATSLTLQTNTITKLSPGLYSTVTY
jgi:hypothetical protein